MNVSWLKLPSCENMLPVSAELVAMANSSATYPDSEKNLTDITMLNASVIWNPEVVFRVSTIVILMAITLTGNGALITITVCHRKLRNRRVNIFLLNLAFGDIMVCVVTMTSEILWVAFDEWVLGPAGCKLIAYGQIVTLASTTFLLTGMSIDRFQVLVKPMRALAGKPKIWRKVVVAWTLAFIFASPQLLIFVETSNSYHDDGRVRPRCLSQGYTAEWQRRVYMTFLTTYILIVPTTIMIYCYSHIIRVVWMRGGDAKNEEPKLRVVFRKTDNSSTDGIGAVVDKDYTSTDVRRQSSVYRCKVSIPKRMVSASKRKVVIMTICVIVGFLMCWTPYFLVSMIRIYSNYTIELKQALNVAELLALAHSALNPIVYCIFSRRATRKILRQLCLNCRLYRKFYADHETMFTDVESNIIWNDVKIPQASDQSFRWVE